MCSDRLTSEVRSSASSDVNVVSNSSTDGSKSRESCRREGGREGGGEGRREGGGGGGGGEGGGRGLEGRDGGEKKLRKRINITKKTSSLSPGLVS